MTLTFEVAANTPRTAAVIGVPVFTSGPVPRQLRVPRARLAELGFDGKPGQLLQVPSPSGPTLVAVGVGERESLSTAVVRDAAAGLARSAAKRPDLATGLAELDVPGASRREVAQAVAEGCVLGTYRFTTFKSDPSEIELARVVLTAPSAVHAAVTTGAARGQAIAEAVALARDLANTPPADLNARDLAERAQKIAADCRLAIEVLDEVDMAEQGLGGLLGVNKGSTEPPRLVKLTYTPRNPVATVALVGKGVMYDSGGISLKPSDGMHVLMKMDMTGAAVVLATLSLLPVLRPKVKVIGYLCCTDNMPSGSAMKLGDVLRIRNGKTVEIHNTDAEGRLVLADGLSLAVEDGADAIVDIATLTGAVLGALGKKVAGVMGNDEGWIEQVRAAAQATDERTWELPLVEDYRKLLDSNVADIKNVGGPYGGAIIAGLFLREFVGGVPWAHLDIAGVMDSDADEGTLSKGATAFGVRLLAELLTTYQPVQAAGSGADA
jgi:leucyl aminopeptidase